MSPEQQAAPPRRPVVAYGVTAAMTARAFLLGQLSAVSDEGMLVHLVVGEARGLAELVASEGAKLHVVPLARDPRPSDDVRALVHLRRVLVAIDPDVVVMGTPKMGLLGLLAATAARVPRRIYVLHGLRLEGAHGRGRAVLWAAERLTCSLATEIVAVSPSLLDKAVSLGLAPRSKVVVLRAGSANGIDLDRFRPPVGRERAAARLVFGLPELGPVVLFVGRLTADKGLEDMAAMWTRVQEEHPAASLLVVGGDETKDGHERKLVRQLAGLPGVHIVGSRPDVERAYWASDVMVLLTRREGMPTTPLEASACGLPVVATTATGTVDAVRSGETGTLVPQCDPAAAAGAVLDVLLDPARGQRMGEAGRRMVESSFRDRDVWDAWTALLSRSDRHAAEPDRP